MSAGPPICLVASNGGHLTQLLSLVETCSPWGFVLVTSYDQHLQDLDVPGPVVFLTDAGRKPLKLLRNAIEALLFVIKTRPRVVITTGAGTGIALCYWAKLLGARIICIETISRVETPSLTSRVLRPITDHLFVQWSHLLKRYPGATYRGSLL